MLISTLPDSTRLHSTGLNRAKMGYNIALLYKADLSFASLGYSKQDFAALDHSKLMTYFFSSYSLP